MSLPASDAQKQRTDSEKVLIIVFVFLFLFFLFFVFFFFVFFVSSKIASTGEKNSCCRQKLCVIFDYSAFQPAEATVNVCLT